MNATTALQRFRQHRRKRIKQTGKRLFRRVDGFLARQSLIPNAPVLDESLFPFAGLLRQNWRAVRKELDALLEYRDELPPFQTIQPDQKRISPDDRWRTVVLWGFGHRSEQNCELCPETARLLEEIPRLETAFLSILAPGKHVPLHKGVTKAMVRCHLGLKVPSDRERCWMKVGDAHCLWSEGDVIFFDDSYPHEVLNDTDEERVVLLFDFERPMALRGRIVGRLLMRLLRRTAFFKDARQNQDEWEARFRKNVLERRRASV